MLAEWEQQSAVQLTWPHKDTDWAPILPEITAVYEEMAREISQREDLIIVAPEGFVKPVAKCQLVIVKSNDTWARDHGFITVKENSGELILLDLTRSTAICTSRAPLRGTTRAIWTLCSRAAPSRVMVKERSSPLPAV